MPAKPVVVKEPTRGKPIQAATPARGKSAAAPGHNKPTTKTHPTPNASPPQSQRPAVVPKPKTPHGVGPSATPARGKSAAAPGRLREPQPEKTTKPAPATTPEKPAAALKPKPEQQAKQTKDEKPAKPS